MFEGSDYFDDKPLSGQPAKHEGQKRSLIVDLEPYPKMFSIGRDISLPPLFCAPREDIFGAEMGWFRALGLSVSFCTDPPCRLGTVLANHNNWSMTIVDCDAFGGSQVVLDGLEAVIRSNLEMPFVLVSRKNRTSSYWNAQSPRMITPLDAELSINSLEDAIFTVLGLDDLTV